MSEEKHLVPAPAVLLLISTHCPHCAAALQVLISLVKQGDIAELKVVNLEQAPEAGEKMAVRSVPWIQINDFIFTGTQTPQAIKNWISQVGSEQGEQNYLEAMLADGNVDEVMRYIRSKPHAIRAVAALMADADAKINLKLGIGVVFEEFATDSLMDEVVPQLVSYLTDPDARVRGDACYYLSLTGKPSLAGELEKCLQDENADVREIAQDGLDALAE